LSKIPLPKDAVNIAMSKSERGLIVYSWEGLPRVLGEFFFYDVEPLVWRGSRFGDVELIEGDLIQKKSLVEIILNMIYPPLKVEIAIHERRKLFIEPNERIKSLIQKLGIDDGNKIFDDQYFCRFYDCLINERFVEL
jgi:hypothetical protein